MQCKIEGSKIDLLNAILTLSQDVQEISRIQQKESLPRLLTLLASQNAQVLNTAKISREIELNAVTTEFGHAFESFVTNEFLRLAQMRDDFIAPGHWRTHDSDEVDLILEFQTGAVVGIEVKAGKMPSDSDFRGLRKLKEYLGNDFHCGILIYQGEFSYRYTEGIIALPADRLWVNP